MVKEPEYATFFHRLTAHMLDAIIIGIPTLLLVVTIIVPSLFQFEPLKEGADNLPVIHSFYKNSVAFSLMAIAATSTIFAFFITSKKQATPGKRIMGIYIAMADGSKPRFKTIFLRYAAMPVFILMVQIFERYETYRRLDELKNSGKKISKVTEIDTYLHSSISEATSVAVLFIILIWYGKIIFTKECTAIHDDMFNTRVLVGKK